MNVQERYRKGAGRVREERWWTLVRYTTSDRGSRGSIIGEEVGGSGTIYLLMGVTDIHSSISDGNIGVGIEGNSDEETDYEDGTTPLPIKVFPLKWRSNEYKQLLYSSDSEIVCKNPSSHLHAGPISESKRSARIRRRVPTDDTANKIITISCPEGKAAQFYDTAFLREAESQGFLPSLRVGTSFPHQLSRV